MRTQIFVVFKVEILLVWKLRKREFKFTGNYSNPRFPSQFESNENPSQLSEFTSQGRVTIQNLSPDFLGLFNGRSSVKDTDGVIRKDLRLPSSQKMNNRPSVLTIISSFTSFTHPSIPSFIHRFVHPSIPSFIHCFIHPSNHLTNNISSLGRRQSFAVLLNSFRFFECLLFQVLHSHYIYTDIYSHSHWHSHYIFTFTLTSCDNDDCHGNNIWNPFWTGNQF